MNTINEITPKQEDIDNTSYDYRLSVRTDI